MSNFDEPSFYEIVELDSGEVALRRVEFQDEEPLVTIRFSPKSNEYLGDARYEVARAMIEAGLDIVAGIEDGQLEDILTPEDFVLH